MSALGHAVLDALDADDLAALRRLLGLDSPAATATDDRWLPTREAAAYLGISVAALHKLTAARSIRFEQSSPGAKCWFRRSDLDRYRRGEHPE